MRMLRAAAWTVFLLDVVVLAQLVYQVLAPNGEPASQAAVRGLAMLLGSGLAGIGIVLVASSWVRSAAGLWVSLFCGVLPLVWVLGVTLQDMWQ